MTYSNTTGKYMFRNRKTGALLKRTAGSRDKARAIKKASFFLYDIVAPNGQVVR